MRSQRPSQSAELTAPPKWEPTLLVSEADNFTEAEPRAA